MCGAVRPVRCFVCGEAGHLRKECPEFPLNGSEGAQVQSAVPKE